MNHQLGSFLLFFTVLFGLGCAQPRIALETGVSHPALGLRHEIRNTNDLHTLEAFHGALRVETTLIDGEYAALDGGIGPSVLTEPGEGWAIGGEVALRGRFKASRLIHPYVITTIGAAYAEGWSGSDVNYTFSNSLGAGLQFNVKDGVALTVDYRWFHHSNGKSFYSDESRSALGLKSTKKNEGYQNGAIFVGLVYDF